MGTPKLNKNWSTHITMLLRTVPRSDGPVLELGAGLFSTPLLHWLCKEHSKKLVTYESDPEFYEFARSFRSRDHSVRFVENWDVIDLTPQWGVVLIDHVAGRRVTDALRLKDNADIIVIHDTESPRTYDYEKLWPHFKYRYDWKDCTPWTTVVSNRRDVSDLGPRTSLL